MKTPGVRHVRGIQWCIQTRQRMLTMHYPFGPSEMWILLARMCWSCDSQLGTTWRTRVLMEGGRLRPLAEFTPVTGRPHHQRTFHTPSTCSHLGPPPAKPKRDYSNWMDLSHTTELSCSPPKPPEARKSMDWRIYISIASQPLAIYAVIMIGLGRCTA